MKKKIAFLLLIIITVFSLLACSAGETADNSGATKSSDGSSGRISVKPSGDGTYTHDSSGETGVEIEGDVFGGDSTVGLPGEENEEYTPGQMTASAYDDNDHYLEWIALFNDATANDPAGKFHAYKTNAWKYDTLHRVKITVKKGEQAVAGAEVTFYDDAQKEYKAKTNANGVAYLFPPSESGTVRIKSGENSATAAFSADNRDLTVTLEDAETKTNLIKLMFVVDVTGSMGDELSFLETELTDVITRVASDNAQVQIDLAILFYRDEEDIEKFAYHDFVNVTNPAGLQRQVEAISHQRALGGGDYPEAVDEAIVLATEKDWGEENSTKIIFFILDAPPHSEAINRTRCAQGVKAAAAKGIRICPILCSGADELCEYVVRQGALITGGTFIYVTDDSGIGGEHLDPELPDVPVEYLNDLMVRVVNGHHTGDFGTPVPIEKPEPEPEPEPDPAPEQGEE